MARKKGSAKKVGYVCKVIHSGANVFMLDDGLQKAVIHDSLKVFVYHVRREVGNIAKSHFDFQNENIREVGENGKTLQIRNLSPKEKKAFFKEWTAETSRAKKVFSSEE